MQYTQFKQNRQKFLKPRKAKIEKKQVKSKILNQRAKRRSSRAQSLRPTTRKGRGGSFGQSRNLGSFEKKVGSVERHNWG